MKDGCYLYVRPDGQALIVQRSNGVLVEVMGAGQSTRRPARLSRRRLGASITDVVREAEARRWARLLGRLGS